MNVNEFASTAVRKLKMKWPEVREILTTLRAVCDVVPVTIEVHEKGLAVAERYGFSLYDSLILAAAHRSGCRVVYSEDLQHGQTLLNLTIRNPFL